MIQKTKTAILAIILITIFSTDNSDKSYDWNHVLDQTSFW